MNNDLKFDLSIGATGGCGATFRNIFWYFGGSGLNKRKVKLHNIESILILLKASKISGCKLEHHVDMNFNFHAGACKTFTDPDPKVLLCFDQTNHRQCHT